MKAKNRTDDEIDLDIYKDIGMKPPKHLLTRLGVETDEDEGEPTPKRKALRTAKIDFNKRMKDKLEEQNEILMLQFQQRSLMAAIQTGDLPAHLQNKPEPTEEKTSLSETIDLITKVKKLFPSQETFEPEPEESMEDFAIKQVIGALANRAAGAGIPPAPVDQPDPVDVPWAEEDLTPPEDIIEMEEENVNAKTDKPVVDTLLEDPVTNVRAPKKEPKRTGRNKGKSGRNKQQALNPAK